jgi:ABC-type dipeptide/oligopeptide/nickel transport system permease subunit
MSEYTQWIYVIVTLVGIIYGSYSGYREAKKADPDIEFEVELFVFSLLRSLPGIIASVASLAVLGVNVEGVITAFFAGVGSDVVLKRTWRSVKG